MDASETHLSCQGHLLNGEHRKGSVDVSSHNRIWKDASARGRETVTPARFVRVRRKTSAPVDSRRRCRIFNYEGGTSRLLK